MEPTEIETTLEEIEEDPDEAKLDSEAIDVVSEEIKDEIETSKVEPEVCIDLLTESGEAWISDEGLTCESLRVIRSDQKQDECDFIWSSGPASKYCCGTCSGGSTGIEVDNTNLPQQSSQSLKLESGQRLAIIRMYTPEGE